MTGMSVKAHALADAENRGSPPGKFNETRLFAVT